MVAFFPECDQDDVLDVYFLANSVFLLLAVTCCDMRRGSVCYRVEIFDWQAPHFVLAHRPSSWQAQQAFLRRGKSLPTLPPLSHSSYSTLSYSNYFTFSYSSYSQLELISVTLSNPSGTSQLSENEGFMRDIFQISRNERFAHDVFQLPCSKLLKRDFVRDFCKLHVRNFQNEFSRL